MHQAHLVLHDIEIAQKINFTYKIVLGLQLFQIFFFFFGNSKLFEDLQKTQ